MILGVCVYVCACVYAYSSKPLRKTQLVPVTGANHSKSDGRQSMDHSFRGFGRGIPGVDSRQSFPHCPECGPQTGGVDIAVRNAECHMVTTVHGAVMRQLLSSELLRDTISIILPTKKT